MSINMNITATIAVSVELGTRTLIFTVRNVECAIVKEMY